jgi:hypothetical protein
MKMTEWMRCLGVAAWAAIALAGFSGSAWSAEPILDLDCVDADGKPSNNFEWSDRGFSVGKRYYQSRIRAYPGAVITCAIPDDVSMLNLIFGLHDTSQAPTSVMLTPYLNGQAQPAQNIVPGEIYNLTLPLDGASSLALSVDCLNPTGCNSWVYFVTADVE